MIVASERPTSSPRHLQSFEQPPGERKQRYLKDCLECPILAKKTPFFALFQKYFPHSSPKRLILTLPENPLMQEMNKQPYSPTQAAFFCSDTHISFICFSVQSADKLLLRLPVPSVTTTALNLCLCFRRTPRRMHLPRTQCRPNVLRPALLLPICILPS